jgi:cell wall-associated NlpC family hydrolase
MPVTQRTPKLNYKGPVYDMVNGQAVPYTPPAPTSGTSSASTLASTVVGATGGGAAAPPTTAGPTATATTPAAPVVPELVVPGSVARYIGGYAAAPVNAPPAVQAMIWTANELIGDPYTWGGGHNPTFSGTPGYDCSGTVSFALHAGGLLNSPLASTGFEGWGDGGIGKWVTIFANGGHAYMTIAGLRLDTSAADDPSNQQGPRWRPLRQHNAGFVVRHPIGL